MARIQLVDDEPMILSALKRTLRGLECEVEAFSDPVLALHALAEKPYEIIVCDHHMPDIEGVTYLQFAKQCQPHSMRILLSGLTDHSALMQAINQAEIYRFIPKPWDDAELLKILSDALTLFESKAQDRKTLSTQPLHQHRDSAQQMQIQVLKTRHGALYEVKRDDDGALVLNEEE